MLKNDGDFYAGKSTGSYIFWDQSTEVLTVKGQITITNASAVRSTLNVADGATANSTDAQIQAGTDADDVGLGSVDNDSTATIRAVGAATSGTTGGWTIAADAIYSGTKDTTGFTSTNGHITISSGGGIHTPMFYVDSSGGAGFKGTVTIGGTNLTTTNTLNANTTAGDVVCRILNSDPY